MAKTFRSRPSELLGISADDSYLAFAIDRAVWYFGTCVEADMQEAEDGLLRRDKQAKAEQLSAVRLAVFTNYMNDDNNEKAKPAKGRFADPRSAMMANQATMRG